LPAGEGSESIGNEHTVWRSMPTALKTNKKYLSPWGNASWDFFLLTDTETGTERGKLRHRMGQFLTKKPPCNASR